MNFFSINHLLPRFGGRETDDDKLTRYDNEVVECNEGGEFDAAMKMQHIEPHYLSQDM